ncbi:nucleotidyltransferase domain-containing protein [Phyllobacterium sp. LjRoot231]
MPSTDKTIAVPSKQFAAARLATRRSLAVSRARAASEALAKLGVDVKVIGSLANGRFGQSSDIDFLVLECPRHLKYGIEGTVEDCLQGFRFDVIYIDDIPPHKRDRFCKEAVSAGHLR